jgi:hypothetical protein
VSAPKIWTRLGIAAARIADTQMSGGVLTILFETASSFYREITQRDSALDWNLQYHTIYHAELPNLLQVQSPEGITVLPQATAFLPDRGFDASAMRIELAPTDFAAPFVVSEVLEKCKTAAKDKILFDGENARLTMVDGNRACFQGSSYFDYVATNLALDYRNGDAPSLRSQINGQGRLEPLNESVLANATGVDGLLFSVDGYLVLQRRRRNVLVRPGQICAGWSGTIDKSDIVNAIHAGGTFDHLDATREMVEEIGISRRHIKALQFLGVTRELVRGGAPEMFYAADVALPRAEIERCYPRDKEGDLIFVPLGFSGRVAGPHSSGAAMSFTGLLEELAAHIKDPLSLPLVTNLALWHRWCSLPP